MIKNQIREQSNLMDIRLVGIFEALVFLTLLLMLNLMFGQGTRYIGVQPHPFGLVVMIISVQYGVKEGILSALLATIFLYLGNVPKQSIGVDYYKYIADILQLPVSWFMYASILGLIAQRRIRDRAKIKNEYEESVKREKTIARAYQDLKEAKETIEMRLVSQLRSSTVAYRALQSIGTLDPNEVLFNITDLIKTIMNPSKMSVYGSGEYGFEVVSSSGWGEDEPYSLRINKESNLYKNIMTQKKLLCIVNAEDEEILGGEGMMMAPLISPDSGQIFGAVKIEEIDFENITISNIETFVILCEWISLAYSNAEKSRKQLEQVAKYGMQQI